MGDADLRAVVRLINEERTYERPLAEKALHKFVYTVYTRPTRTASISDSPISGISSGHSHRHPPTESPLLRRSRFLAQGLRPGYVVVIIRAGVMSSL